MSMSQPQDDAPVVVCQVPGTHMHDVGFGIWGKTGVQDIDRYGRQMELSLILP